MSGHCGGRAFGFSAFTIPYLRLLTLVSCLGLPSCSAFLVDKPPRNHRDLNRFSCTSEVVAPVTDTVVAIGLGATAATGLLLAKGKDDVNLGPIFAVPFGLTAVGFGFSAMHGFLKTAECREAKIELHQRLYGEGE